MPDRRHRHLCVLLLLAIAPVASGGCDDGGEDGCDDAADPCDSAGLTQCAVGGEGVQTCEESSDGCLEWVTTETCGAAETCEPVGTGHECVCEDQCETARDQRCSAEGVETCQQGTSGCLEWVVTDTCGDGQTCQEIADGFDCVCDNDCDEVGATECEGNLLQTCGQDDEGCLVWEATDCTVEADFCDDTGDEAECATCVAGCETEGDSRCTGDVIETCDMDEHGCLDWIAGVDCTDDADYCDDSTGTAGCLSCEHECSALEDTQCDGSLVEECSAGEHGCRVWTTSSDCSEQEPSSTCVELEDDAACADIEGSESCDDASLLSVPAVVGGASFVEDFADDLDPTGAGCSFFADAPEAVFVLDLEAGDLLFVEERGEMDAVISIQTECGAAEPCERSARDSTRYLAPQDGLVWVIVEGKADAEGEWEYEILFQLLLPEECGNLADDDLDGAVDCADWDCRGVAPCDVETDCNDWSDNDGDGWWDCYDPDCDTAPNCAPESDCGDGVDNDGDGRADCEDPGCFGHEPCDVETECSDERDNDRDGRRDCVDSDCDDDPWCFPERDCGDLADNDRDGLRDCEDPGCFGEPECSTETVCRDGWDNDVDGQRDCLDEDCADDPLCMPEGECGDRLDNDRDGPSDCFDPDCFGVEPCDVEAICEDGMDNDADFRVDCDDPDCGCTVETECDDGEDNDLDGWWDCWDPDCYGVEPCVVEYFCGDRRDNDRDGLWDCDDPDCEVGDECVAPRSETDCDDGEDNDWDGGIDCGDPDCFGIDPCDVESLCTDGWDNDADRLTDCADPDCYEDLWCNPEIECNDEEDNDEDSLIDCDDFDCFGIPPCVTETACRDWQDNDRDGWWDCGDPDCFEDPLCLPESDCDDGEDNDQDGATDCTDYDCFGVEPCDEEFGIYCRDWWDNDLDGPWDCDDPDCSDEVVCLPESDCDDGEDNDSDGSTDCSDWDCFGVEPCDEEFGVYCQDGSDNDLDEMWDCEDDDCADEPACVPMAGLWESFGGEWELDVVGYRITFTPDPGDPTIYTFGVTSGVTDFLVEPGSASPTVIYLSDDDYRMYEMTSMPGFEFFGVGYTSLFVGSNGFVSFGAGSAWWEEYLPIVRGLATDLNPSVESSAGTPVITVDESADLVAITYQHVPQCCEAFFPPNDFQIVLHADGSIDLVYVAIGLLDAWSSIGILSGGVGLLPPETNFVE